MPRTQPAASYADRLLTELDESLDLYGEVLDASAIVRKPRADDADDGLMDSRPDEGWAPSDPALEAARMSLLARLRDWMSRYRLLFPCPTPTIAKCLTTSQQRLEFHLIRPDGRGIPGTVGEVKTDVVAAVGALRDLALVLPTDEFPVRLVVDTNVLIDNPDLAVHVATLGHKYMVHLLPVVLGEIDDLKRAGRTPDLRDAAQRAARRLKGLRTNGNVLTGVRVQGQVYAVFEHVEPNADVVPSWLDLTVPDDRLVASTLLLQSAHPGAVLHVATGDINLQTKLTAVRLPFVELP